MQQKCSSDRVHIFINLKDDVVEIKSKDLYGFSKTPFCSWRKPTAQNISRKAHKKKDKDEARKENRIINQP